MAAREWTEAELRDLIAIEVSTGNTMRVLNQAISSGELTTAVQATASAAGSHVAMLATQVKSNAAEINRVLADCRVFVEQSRVEKARPGRCSAVRVRGRVHRRKGTPDI